MHVKNIYPTTTTNEDLIGLAEMASTYLSSMPAALASASYGTQRENDNS